MSATPISQLKREAFAADWQPRVTQSRGPFMTLFFHKGDLTPLSVALFTLAAFGMVLIAIGAR